MKFNETLTSLQEIVIPNFLSNRPQSQEVLYLFVTHFHAVFQLPHIFQFSLLVNENMKPQNVM